MLVLGSFITRFTKHSEVTISGPVEIRVLQENYKRIDSLMKENFERMNDMVAAYETKTQEWRNQIFEKLNVMSLTQEKLGWRLDSVEKELTEIREKKLAELEKEIREMSRRNKNGGNRSPI
jgi:hypothetical protein